MNMGSYVVLASWMDPAIIGRYSQNFTLLFLKPIST